MEKSIGISVETSGRVGSAALTCGPAVLDEVRLSGKMRHSSELMPAVQEMLVKHGFGPSDVGYFYFTSGPGSFTGLRIAVTMAKMLSFALPVKLVGVNTLDAMAENADDYCRQTGREIRRLAAVLDAKKNLFYASIYQHKEGRWVKTAGDLLISAEDLMSRYARDSGDKLHVLGEGLVYYRQKFEEAGGVILPEEFWPARARNVFKAGWPKALAGEFTDPNTLIPLYIRPPEAVEKWESRSK